MTQERLWTVLGVSEPGKPGRVVIWDTADITVGRSPENDLMVDDSDASEGAFGDDETPEDASGVDDHQCALRAMFDEGQGLDIGEFVTSEDGLFLVNPTDLEVFF